MELFLWKQLITFCQKTPLQTFEQVLNTPLKLVEYNLNIYLMLFELKKMIFILQSLHMTFFFIYN